MSFKCGIVGLPNVGKSTLFNALTNSNKAQAANFPFCTIDPNIGVVFVPDSRLDNLAKVSKSKKIINTTISFVDIAGLVKGASKGEGLGNKFLSHIREVDSIIHMIRCFDSDDIQNVNPNVDPIRDLEIIETEMMLADLESIQKRLEKSNKKKIRPGRGIGSGKGKTSGRGHKGQKSRSGVAIKSFEGGQMPLYRRLPKRGFKSFKNNKIAIINLANIQNYHEQKKIDLKESVDLKLLQSKKIISKKYLRLKILGQGEIKTKINIIADLASKSALQKLEKLGGSIQIKK